MKKRHVAKEQTGLSIEVFQPQPNMLYSLDVAAHLAGVCASKTHLPVLGVPLKGWATEGMDALLSTAQMPTGIPVGTLAIGKAGAINAALLAASILSLGDALIRERYLAYRQAQREKALEDDDLVMP